MREPVTRMESSVASWLVCGLSSSGCVLGWAKALPEYPAATMAMAAVPMRSLSERLDMSLTPFRQHDLEWSQSASPGAKLIWVGESGKAKCSKCGRRAADFTRIVALKLQSS